MKILFRTRYFVLLMAMMLACAHAAAQRIVLTPQWTPQSQFAGYYVAQEKGFYKDAGLDVVIRHPSTSNSAVNSIRQGQSNAIVMQLLEAIVEIDRGVELVHVLQVFQHTGLVAVSRTEKLRAINDLRGKKVGVWKSGFGVLASILNKERSLNISWVPFIHNINLFISGAIDATLAMSYNEALQIKAAGFENMPIIRFYGSSYDFPEDALFVTADYYRRYPEKAKAFAEASKRGWEWARSNRKEALEITLKVAARENMPVNLIHQEWMLDEVLMLMSEKEGERPSYVLRNQKLDQLVTLLRKHGYIKDAVTSEQLKEGRYE